MKYSPYIIALSLCSMASIVPAIAGTTSAQAPHLRDSYLQCTAAAHSSADTQACASTEFTYQDGRLNAAYRKLQSQLAPAKRTALRDEERAWVVAKEKACGAQAAVGSTPQNANTNVCTLTKTAARADELEAMLSGSASASNNPYARQPAAAGATGAAVSPVAAQEKGSKMDDLKAFATGGAKILDSQTGDLNGDGRADAVLVLDPPDNGNEKLGEGPARDVVLLVRDASGQLQKFAHNNRIVPCASCGGVAGDPFGYTRLEPGQFTVVNGGGGREHWADEYTFKYSAEKKDWLVAKVVRRVEDRETGKKKQLELTAKELGTVTFKDFDPSHLPEVELP
ncbi:uncharacterized protein YecT (DUF1311 family) [Luteibacter rhizovicinus]|uniref:Uncharacterized protein YecT (DUF1311 family) n=1 Tax=Luteibacter rhizovicinus TaxID=242606 RepID=A0A4V2W4T8_9GAMM|nr:lysozyme inhibitor LprI family protein [Luteibacter rhizovicinus]TCV97219.1 uncharacterized protein YecT (DUF1311 family) [Luteibacter rhizovicinus]